MHVRTLLFFSSPVEILFQQFFLSPPGIKITGKQIQQSNNFSGFLF